jgi:hypothetical protein
MELSERDKASDLWQKLSAHFDELLMKAHKSNEKSIGIELTANIRGRIKLIRELQKLGESQTSATNGN